VNGKLTPPSGNRKSSDPAQRPDVLAAKSRAEAAQFVVREQQARRLEDIGAGVSYSNDRTIDDPNPIQTDRTIGFRFSLPLPLWNNNSGRIHEATAAAARAEKEVAVARLTAGAEVLSARNAMDAYAKILSELDSKVLPQAAQLEEQLRASYSTGQTPLVEVLRARSRRLDLQRQRLDALRDYHLANIRHSSATNLQPASK
jgi:cobalt-zinc-cadmium efflux system outer membrane protein